MRGDVYCDPSGLFKTMRIPFEPDGRKNNGDPDINEKYKNR